MSKPSEKEKVEAFIDDYSGAVLQLWITCEVLKEEVAAMQSKSQDRKKEIVKRLNQEIRKRLEKAWMDRRHRSQLPLPNP